MTPEQTTGLAAGTLTLAAALHTLWDVTASYEYPLDLKGSRRKQLVYTLRNRVGALRLVALTAIVPALVATLSYIFAVGVREVFFA